jgi:hypothetical protein
VVVLPVNLKLVSFAPTSQQKECKRGLSSRGTSSGLGACTGPPSSSAKDEHAGQPSNGSSGMPSTPSWTQEYAMRTILRTRRVSNRQPAATGSCDAPFVLAQRLDQQCAADFRFCHALQHDGEACVITRLD